MEENMPKGRFWTEEEDRWLKENYTTMGGISCAARLRRTPQAIAHRASRLGILRNGANRPSRLLVIDGYLWVSELGGKYAVHRRLMEMHLKRSLSEDEIVHHKDGNSMNNAIENLQLCSRGEHMIIHARERNVLGQFRRADDIVRPSGKPEEMKDKEPS